MTSDRFEIVYRKLGESLQEDEAPQESGRGGGEFQLDVSLEEMDEIDRLRRAAEEIAEPTVTSYTTS